MCNVKLSLDFILLGACLNKKTWRITHKLYYTCKKTFKLGCMISIVHYIYFFPGVIMPPPLICMAGPATWRNSPKGQEGQVRMGYGYRFTCHDLPNIKTLNHIHKHNISANIIKSTPVWGKGYSNYKSFELWWNLPMSFTFQCPHRRLPGGRWRDAEDERDECSLETHLHPQTDKWQVGCKPRSLQAMETGW